MDTDHMQQLQKLNPMFSKKKKKKKMIDVSVPMKDVRLQV